MSVSLEQLAQILVKVLIFSSHEEEILTTVQNFIIPLATNDKSYTFNEEKLSKKEVGKENEALQDDQNKKSWAYERYIKKWFQASTKIDVFNFSFYFVNVEFQQ